MKAAPPSCPVIYGNRHILPKPTAEPAVARITPILVPNFPLCSIINILFSLFFSQILFDSSLFVLHSSLKKHPTDARILPILPMGRQTL